MSQVSPLPLELLARGSGTGGSSQHPDNELTRRISDVLMMTPKRGTPLPDGGINKWIAGGSVSAAHSGGGGSGSGSISSVQHSASRPPISVSPTRAASIQMANMGNSALAKGSLSPDASAQGHARSSTAPAPGLVIGPSIVIDVSAAARISPTAAQSPQFTFAVPAQTPHSSSSSPRSMGLATTTYLSPPAAAPAAAAPPSLPTTAAANVSRKDRSSSASSSASVSQSAPTSPAILVGNAPFASPPSPSKGSMIA